MSDNNVTSVSRRSLLQAAMGAAAMTLPSGTAVAKYQQDRQGDSGIGSAIEQSLRNCNYEKAHAIAAKYNAPFSLSMVEINPSQSPEGGAIPGTQRSISSGLGQNESGFSTQDLFDPPGGPGSSYMGFGAYCVRGGNAIGITLSWTFNVRPVEEWKNALPAPKDGVAITYNPNELQMVPDSAKGFEYSSGVKTKPEGISFDINDEAQINDRKYASDDVRGSISVEVKHNGPEQPAPIAYGDYVHTWKQVRDVINIFNFDIGIGILDLQGPRVPRNWTVQDEIAVLEC